MPHSERGEAFMVSWTICLLIVGLLELYEACQDDQYLELAEHFMADLIELFEDKNGAGLFFTSPHINDCQFAPRASKTGHCHQALPLLSTT